MKILAIRIKNLASLEGISEIDFTQEPLKSAGIFAITGPTGAGKSTILDALCLALYAKTPRYSIAREQGNEVKDIAGGSLQQGDVRNILRDGVADGFAEVDFVGTDNQEYRATWSVKRAYNRADGKLQGENVELKNLSANVAIPGKKTELQHEIVRLVGFSFDQFTRSVLLAQGDFTSFMRAANSEKASLLEKLTGTHIYSQISSLIFYRNAEEDKKLKEIKYKIQGINLLTDEALEQLKASEKDLELQLKSSNAASEQIKIGIDWHKKCQEERIQLNQNQLEYDQAKATKEAASDRFIQLDLVEKVQGISKNFHDWKSTEKELGQKNIDLEQNKSSLAQLNIEKEALTEQLKVAEEDYKIKRKEKEDAAPLLDEAKKLDIQLEEKSKIESSEKSEIETIKIALDELELSYQQEFLHAQQLSDDLKETQKWLEDKKDKGPIAEHKELVLSKLTDAERKLTEISNLSSYIINNQNIAQGFSKSIAELQESAQKKELEFEQFKGELDKLNGRISELSSSNIEEEYRETSIKINQFLEAKSTWTALLNSKKGLSEVLEKLKSQRSEFQQKSELLPGIKESYNTIKIEKETSEKILNQSRLALSENIEKLRAHLSEGEDCPVCGSQEHPYIKHSPFESILLSDLEKNHKDLQGEYDRLVQSQNQLDANISFLSNSIKELEVESKDKEKSAILHQEEWNSLAISKETDKMVENQILSWIESNVNNLQVQYSAQTKTLEALKENREKRDLVANQSEKSGVELNGLNNDILNRQRELKSLNDKIELDKSQKEKADSELENIKKTLDKIFPENRWFEGWKNNMVKFQESLIKFCEEWKQKNEEFISLEKNLNKSQEGINHLTSNLEKEKKVYQDRKDRFQQLENEILTLKNSRNNIFNGIPVDQKLAELEAKIQESSDNIEKIKKELQEFSEKITQAKTLESHLLQEITHKKSLSEKDKEIVTSWLTDFNQSVARQVDLETLEELLSRSHEWINEERKSLRAIDDRINQAASLLEDSKKRLDKELQLNLSEHSFEKLEEQLSAQKLKLEELSEQKTEVNSKLRLNEDNLKTAGSFKKELEEQTAIASAWSKLNEIIGSADGAKFRNLAQEYTLDVLLQYANIHLKILASRYKIERIPNTLGIQVLDEDMGNDIRSVYSLSGGESFLVSLALALGLSSLSSNKLKVESLFIDEGFGSLDPATLNIAMDVLERLHNQGRKVGVISHVQEMTERIPVQIKVSKQSSGKSKLAIISQ